MLQEIKDMIQVIQDCPELFHDGIDVEIIDLLKRIEKYIKIKKGE